jgi:cobalt-zinc-cadmium efflux system membrane fusion protein
MFVDLEVLTDRTPAAVMAVPKSAIVETNNKQRVVFVQNGNAYEATEVTLGREAGNFVEVTGGLFDGDRVVTQRANQLYAQSLRGGTAVDDHSEAPAPSASSPQPSVIPWWIMIPVGGAIAAGMFWAGTFWATRRSRRLAMNPTLNGHETGYEQEFYLNRTSQSEQAHSTKHPEE